MDRLAGLFANPIKPLKAEGTEKRSLVAAATEDYSWSSRTSFPTNLRAAFPVIKNAERINGFYKSLVPL